jgi:hypothetical protein
VAHKYRKQRVDKAFREGLKEKRQAKLKKKLRKKR